jgi:ABC-2 type transport system ATP-binding protein
MLDISLDDRTIRDLSQTSVQVSSLIHPYLRSPLHFPISLHIASGSVLGVIGSNGCGKTTFLKILMQIIIPAKGTVKTSGKLSFLSTNNPLKPNLKLKTQIRFFSPQFQEFPWPEWLNKKYSHLSAGQQRLTAIWCFFNQEADIYIIDEPFIFLDDAAFIKVQQWINYKINNNSIVIFSNQNCEKLTQLENLTILEL